MLHPLLKWAQRKDRIFIEVQLRDIQKESIDLTPSSITFTGSSDSKEYTFTLEFFQQINKQQSKWVKTGFHLLFALFKQDQTKPFWPRLTKQKQKNQYITIDWQKWVDEDQQKEQGHKGLGDYDPSQMQNFDFGNMAGMGGMGGMPGMPGMGGIPGMGGHDHEHGPGCSHDEQQQGNLDDLQKQEEVQQPAKKQ